MRRRGQGAAALLAGIALLLFAAPAQGFTFAPPKGSVFFGVSDRGDAAEFFEFEGLVGKHPALLETFHPWGNSLNAAYERWRETATRPILHISTVNDQTLAEMITPQQIALGGGDDYLLQLNNFFATRGLRAYVRPLGEPNRCLNAWTAVDCDGNQRGGEHTTGWYKQAFRRTSTIVRGGGTIEEINATLAEIGLPPVSRSKGPPPSSLPAAPISIVWSPLPGGSPRVRGNFPGNYWPGSRWVDWVGTDFYSQYPVWRDLNRFYANKRWRGKPFAIAEWAVAGTDDPRFVRQLVAWTVKRPRVRMLVYYRGFGEEDNPYRLGLYPRSESTLRLKIRRDSFPIYAFGHAGTLGPLPPPPPKKTSGPPTAPPTPPAEPIPPEPTP